MKCKTKTNTEVTTVAEISPADIRSFPKVWNLYVKKPKKTKKLSLQFKDESSDSERSISLHDTSNEEIVDHHKHNDMEIALDSLDENKADIGENEFVLVIISLWKCKKT